MEEKLVKGKEPFGAVGRALGFFTLLAVLYAWYIALQAFGALPQTVPTHFVDGSPAEYGSKAFLFTIPLAVTLGPLLLLIISSFRFEIVNGEAFKSTNGRVFVLYLSRVEETERPLWVNRYFEPVLCVAFGLALWGVQFEKTAFSAVEGGGGFAAGGHLNFVLPVAVIFVSVFWLGRVLLALKAKVKRVEN